MNHPARAVFDEPRQQEAAVTSVAGLLVEAARVAKSEPQYRDRDERGSRHGQELSH